MTPITRSVALVAFLNLLSISTASPAPKATSTLPAVAAATSQVYEAMTSEGCFSSSGDFVNQGSYTYQSSGYCQKVCVGLNKPVLGLNQGGNCWCGDLLPAADTQVSDSQCNTPCFGFGQENCGGQSAWTVWLTGIESSVGSASDNSTSSGSSSTSTTSVPSSTNQASTTNSPTTTAASESSGTTTTTTTPAAAVTSLAPQVVTVSGSTIVRYIPTTTVVSTPTGATENDTPTTSHHSNKIAVVVGAIVGVVAFFAIIAAVYLFLRRRQSKKEENRHRRASSIHTFPVMASVMPTLPRLSTLNDHRLDPRIFSEKRQSGVSIFADNEDYSRRILKVANPDSS